MGSQDEPTTKKAGEKEPATEEQQRKYLTSLDIANTPDEAKRRRQRNSMWAAILLYLAESLAPPSQKWMYFLIIIHAVGAFDHPIYLFSPIHAATIWWFPGWWMATSYLSLAFLDKYWQSNRTEEAERFSIRHFTIVTGILYLNWGLAPLFRHFVNIENWNWMLLPLIPRMLTFIHEDVVAINAFVPEGERGVLMALLFQGFQMIFPEPVHWLLYLGISFPPLLLDFPLVEWIYCTLCWWYLGIPVDVAYGLCLMNNQFIQANSTMRYHGGTASTVLQRERLGAIWFTATCLVLRGAQWSFSSQFKLAFGFEDPSWPVGIFWFLVLVCAIAVFYVTRDKNAPISQSTKFQHRQLEGKDGRNAIRLLRLHPQPLGNGPIICDMIHTSLEFAPFYTAISYTWGKPGSYEMIQIDGGEFKVPPNVYSILRGKRSAIHNVTLWIDSICINQEDGEEKTSQVALMRRIFEEANSTIAWIGDVDPIEAKRVVSLLRKVDSWEQILKELDRIKEGFSDDELNQWNALWKMMASSWFERSWIVQEIAVATRPVLRYGGEEIPWEGFAQSITIITLSGFRHLYYFAYEHDQPPQLEPGSGFENAIIMENLRLACKNEDYLALKDMLKVGLMFKATDSIDKVYALLGIIAERGTIHPDHSKSGAKKIKGEAVHEVMCDTITLLEEPNELMTFVSGQNLQTTRRGRNLLRTTSIAMKSTLRFANDMQRLMEKLGPEGKDGGWMNIVPDYTGGNTAEGAFTMVAQDLVKKKDTYSFLHHAGIGRPRNLKGLPSWVPDWTTSLTMVSLPQNNYTPVYLGLKFATEEDLAKSNISEERKKQLAEDRSSREKWLAAGERNAKENMARRRNATPAIEDDEVLEEGGTILRIKGIQVDTISKLMDLSYSTKNLPTDVLDKSEAIYESQINVYVAAWEQARNTYPRSPYASEADIDDVFWRTVIADSNADGTQPATKERVKEWEKWIQGTDAMYPIGSAIAATKSGMELSPDVVEKLFQIRKGYLYRLEIQNSAEMKFTHLLKNEIGPSFKMYRWQTPSTMLKDGKEKGKEKKYIFDDPGLFGKNLFQGCVDFTVGRLFAICGDGWLGLVPDGTKEGDKVIVVKVRGGKKCFVLRSVEGEEGEMVSEEILDLVGEAFFYGMTPVGEKDEKGEKGEKGEMQGEVDGIKGEERYFKLR